MRAFLEEGGFGAFTTTFEDLHGFRQLPGLAVQRLMADGYGFGAEGDWKTAAMVRIMKVHGLGAARRNLVHGGLHLPPRPRRSAGARRPHAGGLPLDRRRPPLAGGAPAGHRRQEAPARLVFTAAAGPAINVSPMDMGNRFRIIVNEVDNRRTRARPAQTAGGPRPLGSQAEPQNRAAAWILAGGAHHTVYSQQIDTRHIEIFCEMAGVELVVIDANTALRQFKRELLWNDAAY
jgi:L-arabinose isomerase